MRSRGKDFFNIAREFEVDPITVFCWITGIRKPSRNNYIKMGKLYPTHFPITLLKVFKKREVYICKECCTTLESKFKKSSGLVLNEKFYAPHFQRRDKTLVCFMCGISNNYDIDKLILPKDQLTRYNNG